MEPPVSVTANPEIEWFSIDDQIWLSWMKPDAPDPLAARSDEAQGMLRGNLLEAHHPRHDTGKVHAVGWIDVTSGNKHEIKSLDPLTIGGAPGHSDSILCAQGCGFHGYVRDGHWVPA